MKSNRGISRRNGSLQGHYYFAILAGIWHALFTVLLAAILPSIHAADRFDFGSVFLTQTSSVPFLVSVSARSEAGSLLTNFNGAARLSASGDHGLAPLTSNPVIFLTNGQWTGSVTIASPYPDTNMRLSCSTNGVFGTSNPFTVCAPDVQLFNLSVAEIVYSPITEKIYATVPATAPSYSNSLVVVDPALGRVETNYYFGDDPSQIAISDDGRFIYCGFNHANVFRRFDLQSKAFDLQVSLGVPDAYPWLQYYVADLAAIPSQPHSIVVSHWGYNTLGARIGIFDDGILRTNLLTVAGGAVQAASSNRFYASLPFTSVTMDEFGVVSYTTGNGLVGVFEPIKYQNGIIFTGGGRVFGAENFAEFGYLPPCSMVEPDVGKGRIYTLASQPVWGGADAWTIYACDSTALQAVRQQPVPGFFGGPMSFVRWGTNGLAISTSQNQLWLIRTDLVPGGASADLSLTTYANPQPPELNSPLTYTIQVTNLGPNISLDARLKNILPLGVDFLSASSSVGSCTFSNGTIEAQLGSLPVNVSATVTILVTPRIIGALTNRAVVSSMNLDANVTNNSQVTILASQHAPFANTQPTWPQPPGNEVLNGFVVPNGLATTAWFEWGERDHFDQITAVTNIAVGGAAVHVSSMVSGLANATVYQCRVVASNSAGLVYGATRLFTTGRKIAGWDVNGKQMDIPSGLSDVVALAAGGYHSLALRKNGSATAWGDNSAGQTNIPLNLDNIVYLGAGDYHSVALRTDGSVAAWGKNNVQQTNVPAGLSDAVNLAVGPYHNLVVKSDGRLVTWGWNDLGQISLPLGLSNVVDVSAGYYHSLVLKADGTLVAWPTNSGPQGTVPVGLSNVVAIASGAFHNLALKNDGTVYAWGENAGQISVPDGLSNVVAIAAGWRQSQALKEDGSIVKWGSIAEPPQGLTNTALLAGGKFFCLADGDNLRPLATPQFVAAPANQDLLLTLNGSDANGDSLTYRIISPPLAGTLFQYANGVRGAAIVASDTVVTDVGHRLIFAPASNASGKPYAQFNFVINDGERDSAPASVTLNIGNTYAHTQAALNIASNSAVLGGMVLPNGLATAAWFEWGERGGFGNTTNAQIVGSGSAVVRVSQPIFGLAPGGVYQCRLVASNVSGVFPGTPVVFSTGQKVSAWGASTYGLNTVPSGLSNVVAVAAGIYHHMALKTDGRVVAWGQNFNGQTNTPADLTNVVAIGAGMGHSIALKTDGTLSAWGLNDYGQRNVPVGLSNVIAVAAGERHNLALKSDGTIAAWGWNASVPVGLSNVVAIAAGQSHNLAVVADGTLVSWGSSSYGLQQLPVASNLLVAVAAGSFHSLALASDGTVFAWGLNSQGQTNLPSSLDHIVRIGKGTYHSLAINSDGQLIEWGNNSVGQATAPIGLKNVVAAEGGVISTLAIGDNVPPYANTQTVSGLANQDLVITLTGSDVNSDPIAFRIVSLPISGRLFQYAAGARGQAILTNGTVVQDASKRLIFVPGINDVGSPYGSFDFVTFDGETNSTVANVSVSIIPPLIPTVQVELLPDGHIPKVSFVGDSNAAYTVWASTNLSTWNLLGPATQISNSWFQYFDADSTNWSHRYYRVGVQ